MEQEVEVAIALIIRTTDPKWWKNKDNVQAAFGERGKDLVLFRYHDWGRPSDRPVDKEYLVEFEETEG